MKTTTKREQQKHLVDLSVITISAAIFGTSFYFIAKEAHVADPTPTLQPTDVQQRTSLEPPTGMVPAERSRKRIVVVRQSRAS